jgi:UDP-N-acetylmuramoylalanine--D-glutamate ligase
MELKGRNALVVGLGKSGLGAVRLLAREGARVAVTDAKGEQALRAQLSGLPVERAFLGGLADEAFAGRDLVVVSPGVPLSTAPIAAARDRGAEVIGEAELAFRFLREPVVGITGTNGKSTTTALTGHLLATAGLRVFTGGNLGTALSERVLQGGALDASVVELSSFQLEAVRDFRCAAAAVLNVTPDHLDRYPSLQAYADAKARIFERQRAGDLAALNGEDERCRRMPTQPGVRRAEFATRTPAVADGVEYALRAKALRGLHNAQNATAALLLARHLGASPEALQRGLDSYPGLPHRLEPVRTLNGVEYVNDSKATNVDSVEKSLSAFEHDVLLLMGGRGKGAPYAPLRALLQGRVKALFTLGEDAPRIEDELGDLLRVERCGDLPTALSRAHAQARPGDVVLLSPACASYDQFRNFEERGERFKELVRSLS